jgi:hypothetical protein
VQSITHDPQRMIRVTMLCPPVASTKLHQDA